MKAIVARENPGFDPCVANSDVLDELGSPACHSTASFTALSVSVGAGRMLHRL
jgi:hypothetical protein